MKRTITLDKNDIVDLISKVFNCDGNSISVDIHGPSQDGPMCSPGSVYFKIEEKAESVDNLSLKAADQEGEAL